MTPEEVGEGLAEETRKRYPQARNTPCAGCQRIKTVEAKLDGLIDKLNPLIEFAAAFMESPAGKLQRALTRRRG